MRFSIFFLFSVVANLSYAFVSLEYADLMFDCDSFGDDVASVMAGADTSSQRELNLAVMGEFVGNQELSPLLTKKFFKGQCKSLVKSSGSDIVNRFRFWQNYLGKLAKTTSMDGGEKENIALVSTGARVKCALSILAKQANGRSINKIVMGKKMKHKAILANQLDDCRCREDKRSFIQIMKGIDARKVGKDKFAQIVTSELKKPFISESLINNPIMYGELESSKCPELTSKSNSELDRVFKANFIADLMFHQANKWKSYKASSSNSRAQVKCAVKKLAKKVKAKNSLFEISSFGDGSIKATQRYDRDQRGFVLGIRYAKEQCARARVQFEKYPPIGGRDSLSIH